jgi:hypothetical protein
MDRSHVANQDPVVAARVHRDQLALDDGEGIRDDRYARQDTRDAGDLVELSRATFAGEDSRQRFLLAAQDVDGERSPFQQRRQRICRLADADQEQRRVQ